MSDERSFSHIMIGQAYDLIALVRADRRNICYESILKWTRIIMANNVA
ncbi:MAG TPA: hypothetical protein VK553_09185 [Candidatus Nitrosopolaris rasttigaisensis]|nr:hypothetical protein [Candidatus Nitrosopolaris rasttigaisensis]